MAALSYDGHKSRLVSETTRKIRIKIDPHYCRRRCSAITLISSNIRFTRMFAGFPKRGVKRLENVDFQCFQALCLRNLENKANIKYIIIQSLVAFRLTPKYMTLNDHEWPFYNVKFCFPTGMSRIFLRGVDFENNCVKTKKTNSYSGLVASNATG